VKIVMDYHGLYAEELYYHRLISWPKKKLLELRTNFLLRFYDCIFVCSIKIKDYFRSVNKNLEIVYEGLDANKFFRIEQNKPDIFTIGYAGNLKPYQGFEYLLEACRRIREKGIFNFRLNLIVSSGASHVPELLQAYGLSDVADVQYKLEQEKVNSVITKSSVLVVPRPSLKMTEYAFPSKLPKDLVTGIPTITTDVGPVNELFGGKDCCVIISSDDVPGNLVKALTQVHAMSDEETHRMGNRAIELILSTLTWKIIGKRVNAILENIR
jgi:glycosyltransferase involved in cell wall biosynthesis